MKTQQTGFSGLQLLVVMATIAAVSFVATPNHPASLDRDRVEAQKATVAEALNYAGESKRKVAQSFMVSNSLPRTASEAFAMKPTNASEPEFITKVRLQYDYAGETVMIMVYLDDGVVENLLGGEQYIYIAGITSSEGDDKLEWQCGARNVDLALLPEHCRS